MYYRTYRPQTIADIDNQERRKLFQDILENPLHLPHAFLFVGPRGTGKTSSARILAKIINCENTVFGGKKGIEPCNECETCRAITAGRYLDVHELDAASNRGVDDIRALRENVRFAPSEGKYKVYIIDEVHMLTKEAFNALLKTLEEPPKNVVFILATTEADKLPQTIVSRCMRVSFQKAKKDELLHSLKRIAVGENITVSSDALEMIAHAASGSFRDAAKLLEMAVRNTDLSLEAIKIFLMGSTQDDPVTLLALILHKDVHGALKYLREFESKGGNGRYLNEELLNGLHAAVLTKGGIENTFTDTDLLKSISQKDLALCMKKLLEAYAMAKYSPIDILPLMIAVVEYGEQKI
ncbi:MAG: DNA polymerase III subunit gamma/tau [Candidatus Roizmanbacteria bacterium]|nr:DNA polymerase III subunit gamma/tau [Candidatus Roizmanbacteria bacterium]